MKTSLRLLACSFLLTACVADPSGSGDDDGTPDADPPRPEVVDETLDLPAVPFAYDDALPAHFQTPVVAALDNTPAGNPITDDGATLGRVLFHDTTLSANGTIACASCHLQRDAFADPAQFSAGFDGGETGRNAMGVMDARYYGNGRFFWDERAATLEEQVLLPIQNEVEMGLTLDQLVERVAAQPYYAYLFERAFGDATVTSERISRALAQFARAIVSYRSRYDEGLAAAGAANLPFPNFTAAENQGKGIFLGACASCHLAGPPPPPPGAPPPPRNEAIFFVDIASNNGLDATTAVDDNGKGDISGAAGDLGRFKSPSLRNVELSGPYMHDGRFADPGRRAHPPPEPRPPPTAPARPRSP